MTTRGASTGTSTRTPADDFISALGLNNFMQQLLQGGFQYESLSSPGWEGSRSNKFNLRQRQHFLISSHFPQCKQEATQQPWCQSCRTISPTRKESTGRPRSPQRGPIDSLTTSNSTNQRSCPDCRSTPTRQPCRAAAKGSIAPPPRTAAV